MGRGTGNVKRSVVQVQRKTWKNVLSFLLVLALTIGTVAALSMVTQAKTETAPAEYSQQIRQEENAEVTELSAAIPEAESTSPLASIGAFLLLLAIPVAGLLIFCKARKRGHSYQEQAHRRYSPRSDMAFQGVMSARTRV